jgi:hypothetical protein
MIKFLIVSKSCSKDNSQLMVTTPQSDTWTKRTFQEAVSNNTDQINNSTLILNWDEIESLELGTILVETAFYNEDLANKIIIEGLLLGHDVIVGNRYLDYLFRPIYFSQAEISLGYTHRIKHFQLTTKVKYVLGVKPHQNDPSRASIYLAAKDLGPQILSSPKVFLEKIQSL